MRKVSLERYYFLLYDGALTLEMSKMALNSFCDKTLHMSFIFLQQLKVLSKIIACVGFICACIVADIRDILKRFILHLLKSLH